MELDDILYRHYAERGNLMDVEVFTRYEFKYMVDSLTYKRLVEALDPYVNTDTHGDEEGFYAVRSLYYDTADNLFHQETLDQEIFRQKLRLRTYGNQPMSDRAFVEIKKQFRGVVSKRRTLIGLQDGYLILDGKIKQIPANRLTSCNQQILREIDFLVKFYQLQPRILIIYDRQAFQGIHETDVRITFDCNLKRVTQNFQFEPAQYGERILPADAFVLEVKVDRRMPLWLARILSELQCFKRRFSKYATGTEAKTALEETGYGTVV